MSSCWLGSETGVWKMPFLVIFIGVPLKKESFEHDFFMLIIISELYV